MVRSRVGVPGNLWGSQGQARTMGVTLGQLPRSDEEQAVGIKMIFLDNSKGNKAEPSQWGIIWCRDLLLGFLSQVIWQLGGTRKMADSSRGPAARDTLSGIIIVGAVVVHLKASIVYFGGHHCWGGGGWLVGTVSTVRWSSPVGLRSWAAGGFRWPATVETQNPIYIYKP